MTKKVIMTMELIMIACVYVAIGLMAATAYVDYKMNLVIVVGGIVAVVVFVTAIMVEFHKAFWG